MVSFVLTAILRYTFSFGGIGEVEAFAMTFEIFAIFGTSGIFGVGDFSSSIEPILLFLSDGTDGTEGRLGTRGSFTGLFYIDININNINPSILSLGFEIFNPSI